MSSTLPWWGFIVAIILTALFMLVFGTQYGITGFQFNLQPFCQMVSKTQLCCQTGYLSAQQFLCFEEFEKGLYLLSCR